MIRPAPGAAGDEKARQAVAVKVKVKVHAWIEEIPKEPGLPSPGPAEELVVEADSYEDGVPLIEAALPAGWRVMNLGRL